MMTSLAVTAEEQTAVTTAAAILRTTRPDVASVLTALSERISAEAKEADEAETASTAWWAARGKA